MNTIRLKPLGLAARIAGIGLLSGPILVALGLYESGLVMKNLLAAGIGITAGSIMLFGAGLAFTVLEQASGRTPSPERDRNTA